LLMMLYQRMKGVIIISNGVDIYDTSEKVCTGFRDW